MSKCSPKTLHTALKKHPRNRQNGITAPEKVRARADPPVVHTPEEPVGASFESAWGAAAALIVQNGTHIGK